MKKSIFIGLFGALLLANQALASVCDDPLKGELCFNMRYLRSQVMALGEQRELMQVNYPYLGVIGQEIDAITRFIDQGHLLGTEHAEGIKAIQAQAQTLIDTAKAEDPMALATANVIQKKCSSCHSPVNASSGIGWDQIFKNDWEHIVKNCSKEGRTPYLCRSMNGMMTAYSGIFSSSQLGRQNFASLKHSAIEIQRIAKDLKDKKMFHGSEEMIAEVGVKAAEVAQLATEEKVEGFEKGLLITQSCMQCHANYNRPMKSLSFSAWR